MQTELGHVVVTGASSGIGSAIAQALLAAGWRVTGLDVAQATIVDGSYAHVPVDLTDGAAIARSAADLPAVDALVHAAGVLRVGALG
ncbi:SDR family NAD(P)-dependent oxidoreductase, partial [Comamonas sp. B-9]|uniref:SDR family NAD(P)-dependent oxidoreductase n=1 Tax=Comamonas sp. B-9 TaxID=1055192 RepID=UPI000395D4ED